MADAMERAHRRVSLLEIMSAVDGGKNSLAGLTLDAVLNSGHRSHPQHMQPSRSKTLLDIIKDEESNKDRRTWRHFIEKLGLKRAGAAWIYTVPIPASDVPTGNNRFQSGPHATLPPDASASDDLIGQVPISDRLVTRQTSVLHGHNQLDPDEDQPDSTGRGDEGGRRLLGAALAEERQLSAREAVAGQAAAEAEAEAAAAAVAEARERESEAVEVDERLLSMSLMDLMGGCGDEDDEEEEEEVYEDAMAEEMGGGSEHTCCVCMVRHKGAAFIPCGHTFCRLCSRELFAQRGRCPICNKLILEILDIF